MNKRFILFLHIALWAFMFLSPLSFLHGNGVGIRQYLMTCMSPFLMMVVFYINYFWLTPECFGTPHHRTYWIVNLIMVICLGIFLHYWMSFVQELFNSGDHLSDSQLSWIDVLFFILRDIFNLAIAAAVATAVILAMRWQHNEEGRLQAETAQTEAELSNLRSQINPHFLLNTLNNIYALTAIDTNKAQDAIQQLSVMLRHMLYDNQETEVEFSKEIQFVENYISLMKIRLPQNVDVKVERDIQNPNLMVAPLLMISLVENAFKHGVSPTEPSFIHIKTTQNESQIEVVIENSNHPKTNQDRSGHGIGLQQVQRRLDLAYAGRYEWSKGPSDDGKTYISKITIKL